MPRTNEKRGNVIMGGVVAGLIGGIAIAIALVVAGLAQGQDIWPNLKGAGYVFLGERAMQPGFDLGAVLVGVASHLAVSIAWGLLFALLFYGASRPATIALGAVWGVIVWMVMAYIVMPIIGLGTSKAPILLSIIEHLIFGLGVGIGFLPFQRTKRVTPPMREVPRFS
jgi:hypothetical protein